MENVPTNCRYKDQCRNTSCKYIHPERKPILCRNGLNCQNENCTYKHEENRMCRFKDGCTTINCAFRHPPAAHLAQKEVKKSSRQRKRTTSFEKPRTQQNPRPSQNNPRTQQNPQFSQHNSRIQQNPQTSQHNPRTQENPQPSQHNPRAQQNPQFSQHNSRTQQNPQPLLDIPWTQLNPQPVLDIPWAQQNPQPVLPIPWTQQNPQPLLDIPWTQQNPQPVLPIPWTQQNPQPVLPIPWTQQNPQPLLHNPRTQQYPQTSQHNSRSHQKPRPQQNPREANAIECHKERVEYIREEINSIIYSVDYNPDNEKENQYIASLHKSLLELETQLKIYYEIKIRSLENQQLFKSSGNREAREIYRLESRLSALSKRKEIEDYVGTHQYLIVEGETGSGKSTQIPQYLADHPNFIGKRILCTQPRKLAAISLAHRVAYEYEGGITTEPGKYVGYHVGGVKKLSHQNRIEFMTEGVMLEKIMKGGENIFKNVGCIIIDEAHERSLICDLLLGTFKRKDPRWKDLMIIVTSATIDLDLFSSYFYNAPSVKIEGRCFPVDIIYEPLHSSDSVDIRKSVINCALKIHRNYNNTQGDILCFLPGQEDVLRAKDLFEAEVAKMPMNNGKILNAKVLSLFGRQEPEEQKLVFEETDDRTRKIIFATDVAETSVTIDGVVYVVDSGIKKEVVFDPKRNISSLKVTTISRSSAIQRAGRSGRTQPGTCYRLYSQDDFENMSANTSPEIFCKPLSLAILTLQEMQIDPLEFDWISSPSKDAIASAKEELMLLGAIDEDEGATELGKVICQTQQDPKLVRMIYRGCQHSYGEAAVTIAATLTVANMFFWNGNDAKSKADAMTQRNKFSLKEGDVVTMYRVFEEWLEIIQGSKNKENKDAAERNNNKIQRKRMASNWCKKNFVNGKAMFLALSTKEELLSLFRRTNIWKSSKSQNNIPSNLEIQRLVLAGYFVHTARMFHSKNMHTRQYYALQSQVSGKLDQRAAILNYNLDADDERECPNWITYDKLFRHSMVIFPTTNAIEESWLEEENPNFYEICRQKTLSLPTELVVKFVSQECLREIIGKHLSNIDNLEKELACSISCDLATGRMALCCTAVKKPDIVKAIEEKIKHVLGELQKQVIEMEHVGGTRFVVGQGFQVTDTLFPQDFSTLYIRNIPKYITLSYLKNFLEEHRGTIQLTEQNNNNTNTAIAKFSSKGEAKTALELFNVVAENIEGLTVSPKLAIRKGTNQNLSCRLKLSWAMGFSTGKAYISFHCPDKANDFIENFDNIFPAAKIAYAHGDDPLRNKAHLPPLKFPLPPLRAIEIPQRQRGEVRKRIYKYRFDTDKINLLDDDYKQKFQYKVTVDNLPSRVDEVELFALLKPYQPKWINIDRVKTNSDFEGNSGQEISIEDKVRKLAPLQQFMQNDQRREPQYFFDRNQYRAGFYIYFESNSLARSAYNGADYSKMELSFEQPHRLELEFTHSLSINVEIYKHLEKQLAALRVEGRFKGINITEPPKRQTRIDFVVLKFQTWHQSNIRWIQEQLAEITSFTRFTSASMELLFTRTGRSLLEPLKKKTYLHINHNGLVILVYGSTEIKEKVIKDIEKIIEKLKAMDLIDEEIVLDKKKVNVNGAEGKKIIRMCEEKQIKYRHFQANRLYVSGSKLSIDRMKIQLDQERFTRSYLRPFKTNTCNLCFDTPEGKCITTSACEHIFCIDCIQPMFEQLPPPFPLKCPACEKPLVINDIMNCATQTALLKVMEVAVLDYAKQHPEDIRKCPNLSCTQLLSYHSRTAGNKGGDFLFCDECIATYCLTCSAELKKPIKSHEDDSCEDIQNGNCSEVGNHVRKIQNTVLNLSCPQCKTVFYDFSGCAAVVCGTCKCGFCGLCLHNCGLDAHAHVLRCPKNPKPYEYFVGERELENAHRTMKTENLQEYLKNIRKQKIRKAVFSGIRKDLIDLGIKTEVFSDVLNIPGDEEESDVESEENEEAPSSNNSQRPWAQYRNENFAVNDDEMLENMGIDMAQQREILQEIERDRQLLLQRERMREEQRRRNIENEREMFWQRNLQMQQEQNRREAERRRQEEERQRIEHQRLRFQRELEAERLRERERERQRNQRRGDCAIL